MAGAHRSAAPRLLKARAVELDGGVVGVAQGVGFFDLDRDRRDPGAFLQQQFANFGGEDFQQTMLALVNVIADELTDAVIVDRVADLVAFPGPRKVEEKLKIDI